MTLKHVLEALKSCDIDPAKYGYGKLNMYYGYGFYIKDGKYYCEYPNDYDRPTKVIIEEIDSEEDFVERFLTNIRWWDRTKWSEITILLDMYETTDKQTKSDLKTTHGKLFELYNPLWNICEKTGYENKWTFHVITTQEQIRNKTYHYGVGFINEKYVVERQNPSVLKESGYETYEYDEYADAFNKLQTFARQDIDVRQSIVDEYIQNYKMDEEERRAAQKICDMLNQNSDDYVVFGIDATDGCNIVYVRDYGYFSYITENAQMKRSVKFHSIGAYEEVVINSLNGIIALECPSCHHRWVADESNIPHGKMYETQCSKCRTLLRRKKV